MRPSGFDPARYFATNASFTIATGGAPTLSRASNVRPDTNGTLSVLKNEPLTRLASGWPSFFSPSMMTVSFHPDPLTGTITAEVTCAIPGTARRRSRSFC